MRYLYLYLTVINLISLFLYGLDKWKAIHHRFRIPEAHLMLLALFGGSPGCLIGMYLFRHKIRKPKFYIGIPLILFGEAAICFLWLR